MYLMTDNNAETLLLKSIEFCRVSKFYRQRKALAGLEHVLQQYIQERTQRATMGLPFDEVDASIKRVEEAIEQVKQQK